MISDISGNISYGDELIVYANNMPIGVTKVNPEENTLLVAWKSLYEYGIETSGYHDGDEIELRLYSQELGKELMVEADLNTSVFGQVPVTIGSITVLDQYVIPGDFELSQNYPNPFNPSTTIDVNVAIDGHIVLSIYDINGRLVSTLADGIYETGYYSFRWNGMDQVGNMVSAGVYFYSLQTEEMNLTRKMILMK